MVHNLGSGSSGNALLICAGDATLLIDCGIPRTRLKRVMADASFGFDRLAAVAISHEHGDHVSALDMLPLAGSALVGTPGTLAALGHLGRAGEAINPGAETRIGPFLLRPLAVSHDASEPCGYSIGVHGRRITVMTDLGRPPEDVAEVLANSHLIVLEANYDQHMLAAGPYPHHLKQRIVSGNGHLSNVQCGDLLAAALAGTAIRPVIWLAHLSKTNNRPDVAERVVEQRLARAGIDLAAAAMMRTGGNVWRGEPGSARHVRPVQLSLGF